jgi:hypothetical protein
MSRVAFHVCIRGPIGPVLRILHDPVRSGGWRRFTNGTGIAVHGLRGVIPIPAETEYLAATASPAVAEASTDGHSFSPVPLQRRVQREDGQESWEPVPPAEYRFLRWTVAELAEDEERVVSARVRIPSAAADSSSP